ncbi:hypothetical protein KCU67_g3071, partial [Aureobasidium melanogenum]
MSTLNHSAATALPIHGPIKQQLVSFSTHLNSIHQHQPDNPTTIQPTSLPSHSSVTPSILQTSLTINKTRIKNVPETVKIRNVPGNIEDWDRKTLFERLEATTDFPLTRFSEYEWRIENDQPRLGPWPPRQQRKN